jgi:hypothetical protein
MFVFCSLVAKQGLVPKIDLWRGHTSLHFALLAKRMNNLASNRLGQLWWNRISNLPEAMPDGAVKLK